jgi:hypothetical protein
MAGVAEGSALGGAGATTGAGVEALALALAMGIGARITSDDAGCDVRDTTRAPPPAINAVAAANTRICRPRGVFRPLPAFFCIDDTAIVAGVGSTFGARGESATVSGSVRANAAGEMLTRSVSFGAGLIAT